ncbi:MAG: YceI family protein [Bacteroidetes bacterium]|nr:YceI family protein [Bacteroidota bacterium]MBS1930540.1 YceI family protein [Bacteroidota bacterium]
MATKKWTIDKAHSQIQFKVKHLMITTITGGFEKYNAEVETEDNDFMTAKISFTADTASVTTGNPERDKHIMSIDFFNVEKYPTMKFVATRYQKLDQNGNYKLFGDLTIRDITKSIVVDAEFAGVVKDPKGNNKAGFVITGSVNRKDFGLKWNVITEAGSLLVGEEVRIDCEIQLSEAI